MSTVFYCLSVISYRVLYIFYPKTVVKCPKFTIWLILKRIEFNLDAI